MNFLDKTSADEFFASLENNLNKQYSFDDNLKDRRVADLKMYLNNAAIALNNAGLEKEAQCVIAITDENMEDCPPDQLLDILSKEESDDCSNCDGGKEPPLSEEELKKIRDMLK